MAQTLNYARPTARQRPSVLALFAHATAAYPLFVIAALYGEWLIWCVLGHRSSWITFFAIHGLAPVGCAAIILNPWYLIHLRASSDHIILRLMALFALWLGTLALLWWDPGLVVYWWFD